MRRMTDEGVQNTYFADGDGDGYGHFGATVQACTLPSGFSVNSDDCDDTNAAVNPAAIEVCNLIDDDCDSLIDEDVLVSFYLDADDDVDAGRPIDASGRSQHER